MTLQLPLQVRLRDAATLEAFEPGANGELCAWLRQALAGGHERGWLWGGPGSGRSHLLQAACHGAMEAGHRAIYLEAGQILDAPEALDDLEACRVVAIDDAERLAGARARAQEVALFDLCNRLQARGNVLLLAATAAPLACGFMLPDLASRLAASTVYRVRALDDAGRIRALLRRARLRGIAMNEATARYILSRFARDSAALFALLDDLDLASLSAQRRVTVPFVRELLARRES